MPSHLFPRSNMMNTLSPAQVEKIIDFWFLPVNASCHGKPRPQWFSKDKEFDLLITEKFAHLVEQALNGTLSVANDSPSCALAYILLLDQFTRNIYRDTPRAFAGDAKARSAAQMMVDTGMDQQLPPMQRCFVYLPFEHSEDIDLQKQSVALFTRLQKETNAYLEELDYAVRHHDVIVQFQRFPHRNAILGRASTAAELAFLALPGSGF